jgi:abortive infection bacteriophage resistance protein
MFKNILIVENNIKSIISYQLSKKYGYREHDYLNPKHFRQESFKLTQVNDILNKMKRQIRLNAKQHRATKHYISNYGYIPMWVSVKVLSFGIMAELYSILKEEDQDEVASYYNVSSYELNIYLALLSNYRNLCAHEDMLYDYQTQRSIPDCKYHELLNINKEYEEYVCGKNDFYAIIIIMKSMLSHDEFRNMMNEISYELERLSGLLHTTNINEVKEKIGFPTNYRDIIDL